MSILNVRMMKVGPFNYTAIIFTSLLSCVLGLVVAVYWSGLSGPFLLDDPANITQNYVNDFDLDEILYVITHNHSGQLGRPVSVLSLVFSGIVHGPVTWGYKYHNLLIHLINGLLILWLLIKVLPRLCESLKYNQVLWVAGSVSACWVLHPLMVSTVLYAVQRMAQLSTLFTLTSILVYVFAREWSIKKSVGFYVLCYLVFPLSLLLAMLSKENGALVPFYVLLTEFVVYKFAFRDTRQKTKVLIFVAIFALSPIILGSLYFLTHFEVMTNYAARDFTLTERLMTQLHVMLFYFKLILLPALSDMSLFHDGWPVVREMSFYTGLLLVGLIGVIGSVFYFQKRAPIIAFGLSWFIASHLMESTVFALELVFEHRNYLASLGLMLPVMYYLVTAQIKLLRLMPIVLFGLLGFMSFARVGEWQSEQVIYAVAVEDHPRSQRAHTAYASLNFNQGNVEEALKHIQIVAELDETEYGSLLLQAAYECSAGIEEGGLLERAVGRARQFPISPYGFFSIDTLLNLIDKGVCPEPVQGQLIVLIESAMTQEDNARNILYLGFLQRQAGKLYFLKGEYAKGFELMILAYENTELNSILFELIQIQIQLGALESAEQLIRLFEEENSSRVQSEKFLLDSLKERLESARQEW